MAVFLLLLLASIFKEKLNFTNSSPSFQWKLKLNTMSRGSPWAWCPLSSASCLPGHLPQPLRALAPSSTRDPRAPPPCNQTTFLYSCLPEAPSFPVPMSMFHFTFAFSLYILPLHFFPLRKNLNWIKQAPLLWSLQPTGGLLSSVSLDVPIQPQSGDTWSQLGRSGLPKKAQLHQDQAVCLATAGPTGGLLAQAVWTAASPGLLQCPPDQRGWFHFPRSQWSCHSCGAYTGGFLGCVACRQGCFRLLSLTPWQASGLFAFL